MSDPIGFMSQDNVAAPASPRGCLKNMVIDETWDAEQAYPTRRLLALPPTKDKQLSSPRLYMTTPHVALAAHVECVHTRSGRLRCSIFIVG